LPWAERIFYLQASTGGGESAAAIYSLVGSVKLNGLDSESNLRNMLSRIAENQVNRIEELPPWNIASELTGDSRHAA